MRQTRTVSVQQLTTHTWTGATELTLIRIAQASENAHRAKLSQKPKFNDLWRRDLSLLPLVSMQPVPVQTFVICPCIRQCVAMCGISGGIKTAVSVTVGCCFVNGRSCMLRLSLFGALHMPESSNAVEIDVSRWNNHKMRWTYKYINKMHVCFMFVGWAMRVWGWGWLSMITYHHISLNFVALFLHVCAGGMWHVKHMENHAEIRRRKLHHIKLYVGCWLEQQKIVDGCVGKQAASTYTDPVFYRIENGSKYRNRKTHKII